MVGFAQDPAATDANSVLLKVQKKLAGIVAVRYTQTREMRYFADNYDNSMKAELYFQFTGEGPLGLQFQGRADKSQFIYADSTSLRVNDEDMTIQSVKATSAKDLESNSYLYNSFASLKKVLPLILAGENIYKSLADTLIGKQRYYNVRVSMPGKYLKGSGGIEVITSPGISQTYTLIIDKKTWLPYQFITHLIRADDSRDYIRMTYANINTKPAAPAANSWKYTGYADTYKPYKAPVRISLVKAGTLLPDFELPEYKATGVNSISLSKYAGKIVLVDFWFKACGPCMEAMPHYNTLQNKYADSNFQLLTVNVEDPVSDIKFFYDKYQPVYPMLYDGKKLWSGLGFTGCPSSVLLDKKGNVASVFFGFDAETVGKQIEKLIAGN